MAVAVRSPRAASQVGGPAPARVRAGAAARTELAVVPRRRRTAGVAMVAAVVAGAMMLGAAAFQTQLARQQLELDRLDRRIRTAQSTYDVLRRERAELRSPGRLVEAAAALGMTMPVQTEFVTIEATDVAAVQRTGAAALETSGEGLAAEFGDYAALKTTAGSAP